MKKPDFKNSIKKLNEFLTKQDIEKIAFKALAGIWVLVILIVAVLRFAHGAREDIERKIIEAATDVKLRAVIKESEFVRYESLLSSVKYPEGSEEYTRAIKRDPFSEYTGEVTVKPGISAKHDFIIKSIERVQLPLVYKGYIELSDRIIGQINWRDSTRFVKVGSSLNSYSIRNITKDRIEAIDGKGQKVDFELNKPVFGDELEAMLYDNITNETFNVRLETEIDEYKVIDIAPDYVILLAKDIEIKLEK
jgi:hypothetical protein